MEKLFRRHMCKKGRGIGNIGGGSSAGVAVIVGEAGPAEPGDNESRRVVTHPQHLKP